MVVGRFHGWPMVRALYNLAIVAVGFAVAILMDYGYVKTGAANDPDSLFRRTQWTVWLYPVSVFALNCWLFRGLRPPGRLAVCVGTAILLWLIQIALLSTIGAEIHYRIGGTD